MSEYTYWQEPNGRVWSTDRPGRQFLAARAMGCTEVKVVPLDAVVIEGPLPEVTMAEGPAWLRAGGAVVVYSSVTAEYADRKIAGWAAIARHLREHPPVDEAQVKALADHLEEVEDSAEPAIRASWESFARRLVQRGVRVEGVSES